MCVRYFAMQEAFGVARETRYGLAHIEPCLLPIYKLSGHNSHEVISIPLIFITCGSHNLVGGFLVVGGLTGDVDGDALREDMSETLSEDALFSRGCEASIAIERGAEASAIRLRNSSRVGGTCGGTCSGTLGWDLVSSFVKCVSLYILASSGQIWFLALLVVSSQLTSPSNSMSEENPTIRPSVLHACKMQFLSTNT